MVDFQTSAFAPVVLGFFGLGCGYLIWGPQELFGFPARDEPVDRAVGVWGIWMPGFCQLLTGTYIFIGMTWFQVFDDPALYMAAVAFSAYGIHWFALGWNRYRGNDGRPNAGMSVAFTILSALGAWVFFAVGGWTVGILFIGLSFVYISDFVNSIRIPWGLKFHGAAHLATGIWLMYLTFGTTLNIALGYHLKAG
ncbi:MAG TPA: hypothetical protein VFJ19_17625 [Nocardioidaceae bacterium]|nr:hypothetical protein [Nocardioidaceae bacterium]